MPNKTKKTKQIGINMPSFCLAYISGKLFQADTLKNKLTDFQTGSLVKTEGFQQNRSRPTWLLLKNIA